MDRKTDRPENSIMGEATASDSEELRLVALVEGVVGRGGATTRALVGQGKTVVGRDLAGVLVGGRSGRHRRCSYGCQSIGWLRQNIMISLEKTD